MKTLIGAAVVLALMMGGPVPTEAQTGNPWSLRARFDVFDFSVKAGAGFSFSDSFELDCAVGFSFVNGDMITYDVVGVSHFFPPLGGGFQVDVEYGLVQASLNFPISAYYWAPGACIVLGYLFPGGHQLSLRAGAGALVGYDLGSWQGVGFMPCLGLEYLWRL